MNDDEGATGIVKAKTLDWVSKAACADMDYELFFPSGRPSPVAREACNGCDVLIHCLAHALDIRPVGFWGGTTEAERRLIRRERDSERNETEGGGR